MTFNNTTKRLERPWTFTSQFAQGDVALRSDFDDVVNDAVASVNAAIAYLEAVIAGSVIVPTDQRYLGTKTAAPTARNDGGTLQIGDLFVLEATQQPHVYTSGGWVRAADAPQPSVFFAGLFDDPDAAAFRASIGLGTSATYPASSFATAAQGTTADNAIPSAVQAKITDFNALPFDKSAQYWCDGTVSNGPGLAEVMSVTFTRANSAAGVVHAIGLGSGRRFQRTRSANTWLSWVETPSAVALTEAVDANNAVKSGPWRLTSACANLPIAASNYNGFVSAISDNDLVQEFVQAGANTKWYRRRVSGTWGSWIRVVDADNFATTLAAMANGAVGTYAYLRNMGAALTQGQVVAGSTLRWSGVATDGSGNSLHGDGGASSGSWMCMGVASSAASYANGASTLFLRVS